MRGSQSLVVDFAVDSFVSPRAPASGESKGLSLAESFVFRGKGHPLEGKSLLDVERALEDSAVLQAVCWGGGSKQQPQERSPNPAAREPRDSSLGIADGARQGEDRKGSDPVRSGGTGNTTSPITDQ